MNYHSNNIINCHIPKIARNVTTNMQLKERFIPIKINIHINKDGVADAVNVTADLDAKFKDCAKQVVSRINFPKPEHIDPTYTYSINLRSME